MTASRVSFFRTPCKASRIKVPWASANNTAFQKAKHLPDTAFLRRQIVKVRLRPQPNRSGLGYRVAAVSDHCVAEHPFRRLHPANETLCDRAIVCFTCGQQDGDKAPFNICECVNLRVAPSARAANSLLLLPLFHPLPSGALSRAWSRSSAYRWTVRSQQVPGTGFPRRRAAPSAQSGYRSLSEDHTRAGNRTSDSRSSARAQCR